MRIQVERTLAIIKPDVYHRAFELLDIIKNAGFTILQKKTVRLSPEEASDFYKEHYGRMFFPALVAYMSRGSIIVLDLAKNNAIEDWKSLIGPSDSNLARETFPNSLRAIYGTDDRKNGLHGSSKSNIAMEEISFFFPNNKMQQESDNEQVDHYFSKNVNECLLEGLTQLCKEKPEKPIVWLAEWLLQYNPNKPIVKFS